MGIWKKCGGYFYSGCTSRLLGTFVSWGFGFFFSPSSFFIFPLLKFEFIKERRNAFCSTNLCFGFAFLLLLRALKIYTL